MELIEKYAEESKDKKYIQEDNKLYLVLGVVALDLNRVDFLEATRKLLQMFKGSTEMVGKKIFVFGTVDGVVKNQVWITKYGGTIDRVITTKKKYTWTGILSKLLKVIIDARSS